MKSIGIISNINKDIGCKKTVELINWLEKKDINAYTTHEIGQHISRTDIGLNESELYDKVDCVIALGGDGTLLRIARQGAAYSKPILGVNMGRLGYLTEVEVNDLYDSLNQVFEDRYFIEKRMMIEAVIKNGERQVEKYIALNDIGIARGSFSRIINVKIYIGDYFADLFPADGLIVSTPTGSTAYSLSAGGPIISPTMELLLITPICPHTLHARPIVVSHDQEIRVDILDDHTDIIVTIDGQSGYELKSGETVSVKKANEYTNLIRLSQRNFYERLRNKLSERNIGVKK